MCNTIDEVEDAQHRAGSASTSSLSGPECTAGSRPPKSTSAPVANRWSAAEGARPRGGPIFDPEHFQNLTRIGPFFELVNKPAVDENQSFLTQIESHRRTIQGVSPHHRCVGGKSLFWGGWAPPLIEQRRTGRPSAMAGGTRDFCCRRRDMPNRPPDRHRYHCRLHSRAVDGTVACHRQEGGRARRRSNLTRVVEAPIAVHAEGAESGLLAMGKFSSLPLLLDSIREDAESSGRL